METDWPEHVGGTLDTDWIRSAFSRPWYTHADRGGPEQPAPGTEAEVGRRRTARLGGPGVGSCTPEENARARISYRPFVIFFGTGRERRRPSAACEL